MNTAEVIPIKKLYVSNSSMKIMCPRKFEFYKLYPRTIKPESDYNTDTGTAMHIAYQTYLQTQDSEKAIYALMKNYPYLQVPDSNNNKSLEACTAALKEMIQHEISYVNKLVYLDIDEERKHVPATELAFEIQLTNVNLGTSAKPVSLSYIGLIDFLLFNKKDREYYVGDIKTHRKSTRDLEMLYKFDQQVTPYGIVLEHIQKRAIERINATFLSVYIDLVEPVVREYTFTRTKADIEDWLAALRDWVMRYREFFKHNYFPRNGGENCMSWNKPCNYNVLCVSRSRDAITKFMTKGDKNIVWEHQQFKPDVIMQMEVPGL